MDLLKLENGKVTSLQIADEINFFREKDSKSYIPMLHKSLLAIIRDEFEEEISQQEILPSEYESRGKKYPLFKLTINQAKQILVRESKLVRKAVIKRLDELENKLNVPMTIEDMIINQAESVKALKSDLIEVKEEVKEIKNDVKNRITLDSGEQLKLQKKIKYVVMSRFDQIKTDNTDEYPGLKRRMFSSIHKELKNKFGVSSYKDVKNSEFIMALNFVENWIEDSVVREGK